MFAKPEQKETVNVNGKNYVVEDLSEKSRYLLGQLQDLGNQQAMTRARLHQIDVCIQGFQSEFESSVTEPEEPQVGGPLADKVIQ